VAPRASAHVLVLAFALLAALPGCSSCKGGATASTRPKVAVSIFPIYDLTRRIAGPDADAVLLLPPGKSEHHFDPTPRQVEEVASAKLGVMVGLGLDPWMDRLLKDAAPSARVLKVGQPQIKGGNGVQDAQRDPTQVVPVTFAVDKRQEILVVHAEAFAADVRLALLPPGAPDTERTLPETIYRGEDPRRHKDGTIG